jgi:hypothetical protein
MHGTSYVFKYCNVLEFCLFQSIVFKTFQFPVIISIYKDGMLCNNKYSEKKMFE